jgi:hypothetical protein
MIVDWNPANQHTYCQSTIKNQQSKLFRTIFPHPTTIDPVTTNHVATAAFGRPSEGEAERPRETASRRQPLT